MHPYKNKCVHLRHMNGKSYNVRTSENVSKIRIGRVHKTIHTKPSTSES